VTEGYGRFDGSTPLTPAEELEQLINDSRPEEIRLQILLHVCMRMALRIEALERHELGNQ
jgi:hypothetical protein